MAVYLNKLTGDGANLLTPRKGSLILYYDTTNKIEIKLIIVS